MPALPTLVAPTVPAADLDRPGGFDWWYADLVDDSGNGAVVVASFGLPMIPLDLAERRRTAPRALPALACSVYADGRVAHWAFQVPDRAAQSPGRRVFGASTVTLGVAGERVAFEAALDGATGGAPFRGTLRIEGRVRRAAGEPAADPHAWSLLCANGAGELDLAVEGKRVTVRGSGYVDRNSGDAPLADLGVARWHWGRVSRDGHTVVWYAAVGPDGVEHGRALRVDADGVVTSVAPPVASGTARGRYLLAHPRWIAVDGLRVPLERPIEDGPFYLRFLLRVEGAVGVAEVCDQAATDRSPLLPLVRMAVDRGSASSRWLPLLVGPPESRLRRWWAS